MAIRGVDIEGPFELRGRDIDEVAVYVLVVVPVGPAEGGELDALGCLPWPLPGGSADPFGLAIAVHGLDQEVVVGAAHVAGRGDRPNLDETFPVVRTRELTDGVTLTPQVPRGSSRVVSGPFRSRPERSRSASSGPSR